MNKRIVAELKKELEYIEAGAETAKHVYAMQKLLELLSEEDATEPAPKLEDNVTMSRRPIAKPVIDEDDDGNGNDIFDF